MDKTQHNPQPFTNEQLRQRSKFFALLDDLGVERLLKIAEPQRFVAGAPLCRSGDPSDAFYLITDGTARIEIDTGEGDGTVDCLTRGSFFGELATILGEPRAISVVAQTDVATLRFDGELVRALLDNYPEVRQHLVQIGIARSELALEELTEDEFADPLVTVAEVDGDD
ncbi:MAG: cyclic nucleotide-binding domain-containing protein [Deltaproteobacteria bacterium]|nr:cyclic nucleotide-binding domain-containing protein [Deltaproteobacteria bacterium]